MRENTKDLCEQLDATIFTGDEFRDDMTRAKFIHEYLNRWRREMDSINETRLEELKEPE